MTPARALTAILRNDRLRRLVGAIALLAFVVAVVLGAAHAGDASDGHDERCSVCFAATAVFAGDLLVAPQLDEHLAVAAAVHAPPARAPVAFEPLLQHAPRGPPSAA